MGIRHGGGELAKPFGMAPQSERILVGWLSGCGVPFFCRIGTLSLWFVFGASRPVSGTAAHGKRIVIVLSLVCLRIPRVPPVASLVR